MLLVDALKKYLSWCLRERSWRGNRVKEPGWRVTGETDGLDGNTPGRFGWWRQYHNQLLIMAVLVSAAAMALFLLVGEISGYPVVPVGIAIVTGSGIGFLLSYRKRYARVAAGEFVRAHRVHWTRAQRIIQYMKSLTFSVPVSSGVLIASVAYFALLGMLGPILGLLLGMSITCWILYCITVFWEQSRHTILISEKGSMYNTMGMAMPDEDRAERPV